MLSRGISLPPSLLPSPHPLPPAPSQPPEAVQTDFDTYFTPDDLLLNKPKTWGLGFILAIAMCVGREAPNLNLKSQKIV